MLLAETVRVSMGSLMKEDKMDRVSGCSMRCAEIPGLEKSRVIRGKVNELFLKVREKGKYREQKAIDNYRK